MKQIFEDYHQECNNALSYPFSKPQLINIVDHEVIYPDIIKFTLYGDLTGRESLSLLHKPTTNLYTQLEKIIGKNIRSINGIKRVYK
jgi:hypothetical protein